MTVTTSGPLVLIAGMPATMRRELGDSKAHIRRVQAALAALA